MPDNGRNGVVDVIKAFNTRIAQSFRDVARRSAVVALLVPISLAPFVEFAEASSIAELRGKRVRSGIVTGFRWCRGSVCSGIAAIPVSVNIYADKSGKLFLYDEVKGGKSGSGEIFGKNGVEMTRNIKGGKGDTYSLRVRPNSRGAAVTYTNDFRSNGYIGTYNFSIVVNGSSCTVQDVSVKHRSRDAKYKLRTDIPVSTACRIVSN